MFATSAHGLKYRERGLPCQDSSSTLEFDGVQVVAVADGHGGKDYLRSDRGSRLAVKVFFEQIKIFCRNITAGENFSDAGIRNFLFAVCNEWREAVMSDWRENPFDTDEPRWANVSDKYKARFASTDEKILAQHVPVVYGTTLLGALSIGSQVLLIQIGDGTCVIGFALTRESVRNDLLPYITEHGSNDDISLAYMVPYDKNLLQRTLKRNFINRAVKPLALAMGI